MRLSAGISNYLWGSLILVYQCDNVSDEGKITAKKAGTVTITTQVVQNSKTYTYKTKVDKKRFERKTKNSVWEQKKVKMPLGKDIWNVCVNTENAETEILSIEDKETVVVGEISAMVLIR